MLFCQDKIFFGIALHIQQNVFLNSQGSSLGRY